MPMRYATEATVLAALKIDALKLKDEAAALAATERVTSLENGLAEALDGMIGRSFGEAPVAVTRTIAGGNSPILVIHDGIRSVVQIETGGTWDGATWTDADTVDAKDYALWSMDPDGVAYSIRSYGADWEGSVRVTGIFGDQPVEAVPADIREAMTTLTVKEYRRVTSSPMDAVGPDGQVISTPSGWNDPTVKAAIDRYRLIRLVV